MPFDLFTVSAVVHELNQQILGARVERIHQPLATDLLFTLFGGGPTSGGKKQLLISSHPALARVHLTLEKKENPLIPPPFCLLLRRHLEGSRFLRITQVPGERIVRFDFSALDELGNPSRKTLVVELMGKHSNVILINEAGMILDSLKRIGPGLSRFRQILPGLPYSLPPAARGLDPLTLTPDALTAVLEAAPAKKVWEALLEGVRGLSPFLAKEIVWRGLETFRRSQSSPVWPGGDPLVLTAGELPVTARPFLYQALLDLFSQVERGEFRPTLLLDEKGRPVDFSVINPLIHPGEKRPYASVNSLLDDYYAVKSLILAIEEQRAALKAVVSAQLKKTERKTELQAQDLQEAGRAEEYRLFGELLKANLYRLKPGLTEVRVENFYDQNSAPVVIPLEPGLTPVENVQAYFRRYTKAKKTLEKAEPQWEQGRAEIAYLQGVLQALEQAETSLELQEIAEELRQEGYLKSELRDQRKKPAEKRGERAEWGKAKEQRGEKSTSAPRRFISSDGYEILVGKNNRQNDYLTFKVAKPEDIWLHTKDIPGSHVLIRVRELADEPTPANISRPVAEEPTTAATIWQRAAGEEPALAAASQTARGVQRGGFGNETEITLVYGVPETTLREAAALAAHFSQARHSSNVPVDYTLRRYVKKPAGARPGMVIYTHQKTLYVNPTLSLTEI